MASLGSGFKAAPSVGCLHPRCIRPPAKMAYIILTLGMLDYRQKDVSVTLTAQHPLHTIRRLRSLQHRGANIKVRHSYITAHAWSH